MKYKIEPKVEIKINGETYSYKLFESLKLLDEINSQRAVAKRLNISHSVLNRRIKNAEKRLGFDLVKISGSRTYLTEKSKNLVNIYEKYNSRVVETDKLIIAGGHIITNFLESISNEIPFEVDIYSSDDNSAYKLAKKRFG
ncbi:helix-turn-helix domain-containing protein [Methanobrevibacter arboriphilus]|uniref:helix-turn-helix domain-containing protein n=1 Tax=Methanobrevibacter arboriphilus TaxID=39441 RepID=UPI000AE0DBC6|nr:LysR family transcriptional regulator [Methanobrevibacter arboriphilus]